MTAKVGGGVPPALDDWVVLPKNGEVAEEGSNVKRMEEGLPPSSGTATPATESAPLTDSSNQAPPPSKLVQLFWKLGICFRCCSPPDEKET